MPATLPTNYQKHTTTNPLQKKLIDHFYEALIGMVREIEPQRILDAGCGEGFTLDKLATLKLGKKNVGIDYSKESIKLGKKVNKQLDLQVGNIYKLTFKAKSFDLVLCNEVLEHLEDPVAAIKELKRVTSHYILFSVPHEPFFMMSNFLRGKYFKSWGNHPEHINHWSQASFVQLLESQGLTVSKVTLSFPWIMVLAEK